MGRAEKKKERTECETMEAEESYFWPQSGLQREDKQAVEGTHLTDVDYEYEYNMRDRKEGTHEIGGAWVNLNRECPPGVSELDRNHIGSAVTEG